MASASHRLAVSRGLLIYSLSLCQCLLYKRVAFVNHSHNLIGRIYKHIGGDVGGDEFANLHQPLYKPRVGALDDDDINIAVFVEIAASR